MIFSDYRVIMQEKFERQNSIKELEYHAAGACVHIGPVSPGCRVCFTGEEFQIGTKCQFKCPMCYYDRKKNDSGVRKDVATRLTDHFYNGLFADQNKLVGISFQSSGETLYYMNDIHNFCTINKRIENIRNVAIYQFLYTNGVLANKINLKLLWDMNIDEIRFHVSASDFSKTVIDNMYEAAKMGFTVTVEEPSWPAHKKKLIEFLPTMKDIGVSHLDIVEVQVTEWNKSDIDAVYPKGRYYKDAFYHMYDEGMVYDIIEEVIAKGYSFSVLDCNSWVERHRQVVIFNEALFDLNSVDGMCAPFKGHKKEK